MKKLIITFLFLSMVVGLIAQSQIDMVWERASTNSNLPSWFSTSSTERGFGYNYATDEVYVVNRNGGTFVRILKASDGTDVGTLDVTGIIGGTFPLNDIGASIDGKLYATNLSIGASTVTKVYKWDDDSDAPSVAFESDLGGVDNKRTGDKMTVVGRADDNSVKIYLADATNSKVYILGTSDFGETFTVESTIVLAASTFGSSPAVYPMGTDGVAVNSNGKYIQGFDFDGNLMGEISGTIVGTGSNALAILEMNTATYILTFQYGATTENARLVAIGDDPAGAISVGQTPSLYTNSNPNGTGDIDLKYNSDGTITVFVLSTNNGLGAYTISMPSNVDGLAFENYNEVGSKENSNAGFGSAIDVSALRYYTDDTYLHVFVDGKLDITNSNGIALFVGLTNLAGQGAAAGTALGGVTDGGHLFGAGASSFMNDFETHYAFVANPGSGNTNVYVDAVSYVGTPTAQYLGSCDQEGTMTSGPGADGIFTANTFEFAFKNDLPDNHRGWEIQIPLDQIGSPTGSDNIELFAVVVSNTAYFSDVTVPGNISGGNLGENPNFSTLGGSPFHTLGAPVPVELVSFNSSVIGNSVNLTWETATEINNSGFEVQRSTNNANFKSVNFISGKGTTTETSRYSFVDSQLPSGTYYYRLKQIDFDGTFEFSKTVEVNIGELPTEFALNQNYPNPFNPTTSISFTVAQNGPAKLAVYNMLGQEVATLFNSSAEAGKQYKVNFDASNLSSGIYIYSLKQNNSIVTKKMTLIK